MESIDIKALIQNKLGLVLTWGTRITDKKSTVPENIAFRAFLYLE